MDRRGGDWARQREIFEELLSIVRSEPVLVSIHSNGATTEVVEHLHDAEMLGAILHWFNGDDSDITRAIETDAYFSVNAAMSEDRLRMLPPERVLCETDFPARKARARKPADTQRVEHLLRVSDKSPDEVRAKTWWNLRTLCERSGAIEWLPEPVADTLLYLCQLQFTSRSHWPAALCAPTRSRGELRAVSRSTITRPCATARDASSGAPCFASQPLRLCCDSFEQAD